MQCASCERCVVCKSVAAPFIDNVNPLSTSLSLADCNVRACGRPGVGGSYGPGVWAAKLISQTTLVTGWLSFTTDPL